MALYSNDVQTSCAPWNTPTASQWLAHSIICVALMAGAQQDQRRTMIEPITEKLHPFFHTRKSLRSRTKLIRSVTVIKILKNPLES